MLQKGVVFCLRNQFVCLFMYKAHYAVQILVPAEGFGKVVFLIPFGQKNAFVWWMLSYSCQTELYFLWVFLKPHEERGNFENIL